MAFSVRSNQPRQFITTKPMIRTALVNKNDFHKVNTNQLYNDLLIGNNTLYYQNTMGNYNNDNRLNYATNSPMVEMTSTNVWDAIQYPNLPFNKELRGLQDGYNILVPLTTPYNRLNINFKPDSSQFTMSKGVNKPEEMSLEDGQEFNDISNDTILGEEIAPITNQRIEASFGVGEDINDPLIKKRLHTLATEYGDNATCYKDSLLHMPE